MEKQIYSFYQAPFRGDENIFELWARAAEVGAAIVPSVYDCKYQIFLVELIENLLQGVKTAPLLSIGSGVGSVEKILLEIGYNNIICTDIMKEAVLILREKGLNALQCSGLALPADLKLPKFKLLLMDGCLGHMADSFSEPSAKSFLKPLMEVRVAICSGGYLVLSDDPPSQDRDFELNPRVPLLRVSNRILLQQLNDCGFSVVNTFSHKYQKPEIGAIFRRIVVARKEQPLINS